MSYHMTRFPPGSLRELISISFPLMLTAFSGNMMIFCDRIILARYSVDAMTAAFASSMVFAAIAFFGVGITAIAEVFVGQYNGRGEFDKLAAPVWQMIWFALMFSLLMIPIVMFGADWFLPKSLVQEGKTYFQIVMSGAFFLPLSAAVSSFFIGQGKTKMVTAAAIIGNVINLVLDIVLINGVDGWFSPLGATGAALATVASMFIQFVMLFLIFWSKENNREYKTRSYVFDWIIFKSCIKIGLPVGGSILLEVAGWSVLNIVLGAVNKDYVTAQSIGSSFFILFAFFSDGLSKAITAIASNFIGAGKKSLIKRLFRSALLMHFSMASILFVLLIITPDFTLNLFLESSSIKGNVRSIALITMTGTFFLFVFDGMVWMVAAILRAGGDTRFVMFVNVTCVWLAILASYLILSRQPDNVRAVFLYVMPLYAVVTMIILSYRYLSNKWVQLKVDKLD